MSEAIEAPETTETIEQPAVPENAPPFLSTVLTGKKPDAPKESAPPKPVAAPPAPAKTEAKPAAATVTDDEDDELKWVPPSDIKSEKGKEGWIELKRSAKTARAEAKTLKERAAALEKQLAEKNVPTIPEDVKAEMEAMRKERDELSDRLKIADVTSHPKFKAYFDGKMTQNVEAAKAIVGAEHAPLIERILKIGDPETRSERLDELMAGLSDSKKSRLGAIITNLEMLEQERLSEISKASERSAQLQQQTKAEQEARTRRLASQADQLLAAGAKMEAFDPGDGTDAARMAEIQEYQQFVRAAVTGSIDEQDAQFLPLAAVQGLYFKTKVVPQLNARIKELEDQVKAYEGAKPRGGGGTGSDAPKGPKGFLEIMAGTQ